MILERRIRAKYRGVADVTCKGGVVGPCEIRNISLNGVFIEGPPELFRECQLREKENCVVDIKLGHDGIINIQITAESVRMVEDGVGLKFIEMGPEALDHLRKVVMYNSDDPEDFLKECANRPGFK